MGSTAAARQTSMFLLDRDMRILIAEGEGVRGLPQSPPCPSTRPMASSSPRWWWSATSRSERPPSAGWPSIRASRNAWPGLVNSPCVSASRRSCSSMCSCLGACVVGHFPVANGSLTKPVAGDDVQALRSGAEFEHGAELELEGGGDCAELAMSRWIDSPSVSFTGPTQLEKTTCAMDSVANRRMARSGKGATSSL
jgi:hypothetical protein